MALPSNATQALTDQYNTASTDAANGLTSMIGAHNAEYGAAGTAFDTQYGLPDMQKTIQGYKDSITGMQKTLSDLPQNVLARDKGTLTNAAQVSRQTTAEGIPIQKNINDTGLVLNPLETNYATLETNKTNQLAILRDNQAREESGYTKSNELKLNALLDKLTAQRTLDKSELDQANAMALQAAQYHASSKTAADTTQAKSIASFQSDLSSGLGAKVAIHGEENNTDANGNPAGYITRETLIKRLQQQHSDIDPNDIARAVYEYYAG